MGQKIHYRTILSFGTRLMKMKKLRAFALALLFSTTMYAHPEPSPIQAICEIELRNGEVYRGYMCIGVDHKVAIDGFYLIFEHSSHPVLFRKRLVSIDLTTGTFYTNTGKTSGYFNKGIPKIRYFKDLNYRYYPPEEIFVEGDGKIELIKKDVEKYMILDSLILYEELPKLFLEYGDERIEKQATKICVEDIKVFSFILKPGETELMAIQEAEQSFIRKYGESEDFSVNLPIWYHNLDSRYEGFKSRTF